MVFYYQKWFRLDFSNTFPNSGVNSGVTPEFSEPKYRNRSRNTPKSILVTLRPVLTLLDGILPSKTTKTKFSAHVSQLGRQLGRLARVFRTEIMANRPKNPFRIQCSPATIGCRPSCWLSITESDVWRGLGRVLPTRASTRASRPSFVSKNGGNIRYG